MFLSRVLVLLAVGVVVCAGDGSAAHADEVVFARHLSLSPDGQTLAFTWAGDIWTVSTDGGVAQRLTVNPARESAPVWARDGERLAFLSTRHGAANVFIMNPHGGEITRLTFDDQAAVPTDWSPDGQTVYFHANREGQLFWEAKVYGAPTAVGQPWRTMDCYGASARVSPDGQCIAFVRGNSKWWRRRYRGSANFDIWLHNTATGEFTQLTDFDGTDRSPMWDGDGRGLYFLSERGGTVNVWYQPVDSGAARPVTDLDEDDVRDLTVSADGSTLAFTHWDKLYVMSLPDGAPREIHVMAGADTPYRPVDWRTFRDSADEIEVSPDGKEIALVVHGELFVIKTEEKKPTRRVTDSPYRDQDVTWSPDGKALFFVSDRTGTEQVFRATSAEEPAKALSDSLRFKVEQVTDAVDPSFSPQISPDGKKLSCVRLRGDLIIRDLKSGKEQTLLESWSSPGARWSADSKWIAYSVEDIEHNSDVWVVPVDGSTPAVNISQHPDYDGDPQWSYDGRVLAFSSERHGFDTDLYLVFLAPELNEMSTVDRDEYFEKQAEKVEKRKPVKSAVASGKIRLAGEAPETQPAEDESADEDSQAAGADAKPEDEKEAEDDEVTLQSQLRALLKRITAEPAKPKKKDKKKTEEEKTYEYDLATAYERIRRVTRLPESQSQFALSPDGSELIFTSRHEGDANVYTINWNGEERKRVLSGGVGALQWDLNGKKLYYLKRGVPNSCSASGSGAKAHAFRAKMAIDRAAEARQKFDDGARAMGRGFYHPTLKGLDWPALSAKYRELAIKTHTVQEFNEVFSMLLGELNGSHLGIFGGEHGGGASEQIGYLGCEFDADYDGPGMKVASITPRSSADRAESKLMIGDVIISVNGQEVGPTEPLARTLIDTIGDPVMLEVLPSPARKAKPKQDEPDGEADESAETAKDDDAGNTEPETFEILLRPMSYGQYAGLQYRAWVEANRAHVEEQSCGRVGYCHIRAMGESSFEVFERDLYAAAHGKDGLIIDVRSNGGGWTADWVMAVLSVRRHAYTVPRGAEGRGYPQGRLIFYAWTKPATMMCNQYSYSNAEIISHAFKNLGRGPLVGMTTFGAVISTGGYRLIDGAHVRMPFRGWYTLPDGQDMELNGARPDILVTEGPADEVAGRQPQLDAAIKATLEQFADGQANAGPR